MNNNVCSVCVGACIPSQWTKRGIFIMITLDKLEIKIHGCCLLQHFYESFDPFFKCSVLTLLERTSTIINRRYK